MPITLRYTLGRGIVYFKQESTNGYIDMGNINDFKVSIAVEKLEHFSSRQGLKVKDEDITTQQTASGSMVIDSVDIQTLRLFAMASAVVDVSQSSGSSSAVDNVVYHDKWTKVLDGSSNHIVDLQGTITVENSAQSQTYVENTDYEIDKTTGLISALSGGAISDGETVKISVGTIPAKTMEKINAGTATQIRGDILFVGKPAKGLIQNFECFGNVTPEGDMSFIGEAFQQYSLAFECIDQGAGGGLYQIQTRGVQ